MSEKLPPIGTAVEFEYHGSVFCYVRKQPKVKRWLIKHGWKHLARFIGDCMEGETVETPHFEMTTGVIYGYETGKGTLFVKIAMTLSEAEYLMEHGYQMWQDRNIPPAKEIVGSFPIEMITLRTCREK